MMTTSVRARAIVWMAFACLTVPNLAAAQLAGVVRDSATLEPVAGVRVSARALDVKLQTDADGKFALTEQQVASAASIELTAAAVGYYIAVHAASADGTTGAYADVELLIEKVPVSDGSDFVFPATDSCDRCHESIYEDWKQSAMAKAGGNTWVQDVYNGDATPDGSGGFVYTRDSKLKDSNPNSECAACHQPERWVNEPGAALTKDLSDPGAAHGISCSVCHRIAEIDVTKTNFPGLHSELVKLTLAKDGEPTIVQYGPLDDVAFQRPNVMRPSYQPQVLSDFCAACHQDKNDPDEDGDFEEDNGVVSEPTYEEWVQSTYADPESDDYKTCAGCHMKVSAAPSACSEVTPTPPRREGELRKHTFEGTTAEYLENAATLSLSLSEDNGELEVEVSVHNDRTGHHVPTGVTIRNMILLVEAVRAGDEAPLESLGEQVVHELGGVGSPDEGYFAGLPGKLFAKINSGADGSSPVFFSEATGIESDTRIAAKQTDVTHYRFRAPADGGEVEVRARLIYRRSWRILVDAKKWTQDGHGNELEDLTAPHFGHLMEAATARFSFGPSSADAGTDAGASGADGGGSPRTGQAESESDGCGCATVGTPRRASTHVVFIGLALAAWLLRRGSRRRVSPIALRRAKLGDRAVSAKACGRRTD